MPCSAISGRHNGTDAAANSDAADDEGRSTALAAVRRRRVASQSNGLRARRRAPARSDIAAWLAAVGDSSGRSPVHLRLAFQSSKRRDVPERLWCGAVPRLDELGSAALSKRDRSGRTGAASAHSHTAMMIHLVNGSCHLLWCSIGDPQEVTGRIEDPEVCQAPCAVPEILFQWPSCCYDPVALSLRRRSDLKYQFHANGRPPFCEGRKEVAALREPQEVAAEPPRCGPHHASVRRTHADRRADLS